MSHTQPTHRPHWAIAFGQDAIGWFASFAIQGIEQRLRWIPPGTFQMGSPTDEAGRQDHEGPAHPVTLSRGFWLGEVPVTQALWTAVMGDNPSHFVDPHRPVERVAFAEAARFAWELGEITEDDWTLPTEARWEYACRAGTTTPAWTGTPRVLGRNHAPALDAIAWYAGNSGVGYAHETHVPSAAWPQTQYAHTRAGTRVVGQKAPNPFGLYDMLGNVWEWCRDRWAEGYSAAAVIDPQGPREGQERVTRGGSFLSEAAFVRAACRASLDADMRTAYTGFRIASP
jgi:formylglycine-generating enzyme required for sulfatase activity